MIAKNLDYRLKYGYFILSIILFVIIAVRCAVVPFVHDEMATFVMYVQNGEFWPYHSIVDANNHILNSGLSHISFKLFGDSLFALRLPNLAAFVLLIFAVYRLLFHIRSTVGKITAISLLLIAFNWISFFNICRGYGMSMALLVTSFVFMLEYFREKKIWLFYGFLLSIQLAIGSNLTLILTAIMLSGFIFLFQLLNKLLVNPKIWPGYLMHFFSLYLWIDFSFFLQKGNALYYGQGDSYWEITFVTLIEMLTGWINLNFDMLIALLMMAASATSLFLIFRNKISERVISMQPLLVFTVLFTGLLLAFYILHLWKDINFPEDRTALFYYPAGVLMLVFLIDEINSEKIKKIFWIIPIAVALQFFLLVNFKNHPMNEYETFPERFYLRMEEAQNNSKEKITISGHRLNELMYAYFNYRHGGNLNPVDDSEVFNICGDYGITKTDDKSRYREYYEVIDSADWNFVLLKRKKKCRRTEIPLSHKTGWIEDTDEFNDFYRLNDSVPVEWINKQIAIDLNFSIDHTSQPFNGWLVFDVKNKNGEQLLYKRAAFNWLKFTWNSINNYELILMGNELPEDAGSIVVYLWNPKKQFIRMQMNSIKLLLLD